MFGRHVEVKMVKNSKHSVEPIVAEVAFEKRVTVIGNSIERGLRNVGVVVIGYLILDTVRQVVIESAKK